MMIDIWNEIQLLQYLNITVFRNVMPCSLVEICLFEEDAALLFKLLTLMMEEAHASEATKFLLHYQCHILEGNNLHSHHC